MTYWNYSEERKQRLYVPQITAAPGKGRRGSFQSRHWPDFLAYCGVWAGEVSAATRFVVGLRGLG